MSNQNDKRPTTKAIRVSVVFPCLNEAESVGKCVDEATEAARLAGYELEILVVDNGSTDASAEVALRHGATVIPERSPGYGRALRTGISAATGDIVVMADADLSYPLDRLADLVDPVAAGEAEMMIGDRLSALDRGSMPLLHRYIGTPTLSFLVRRAAAGLKVGDSQSGFRAFRRQAIDELNLRSDGMEFASEMLIRGARRGLRIKSISTGYRPRAGESKLNTLGDGWRHLQLIALLAPHLLLVWPGVAMFTAGALVTGFTLLQPSGISVGSVSWQPVFFSSIALILGMQFALAGAVLAHRSSVLADDIRQRYEFVGRPSFPKQCATFGSLAALAGVLLDAVLFVVWIAGGELEQRGLALASLAQSLIVGGVTAAMFAVVDALIGRTSADKETAASVPAGHSVS